MLSGWRSSFEQFYYDPTLFNIRERVERYTYITETTMVISVAAPPLWWSLLMKCLWSPESGGKAYHLMEMTKAGLPVPSFAVFFAFDCFNRVDSMDFLWLVRPLIKGDLEFRSAKSRTIDLGQRDLPRKTVPAGSWAAKLFHLVSVSSLFVSKNSIWKLSLSCWQFESQLDIPIDHLSQSLEHTFLSSIGIRSGLISSSKGLVYRSLMNCLVQSWLRGFSSVLILQPTLREF